MSFDLSSIDDGLIAFGTPRQQEILRAIKQHGGVRPAERALGLSTGCASVALKRVRAAAAMRGYSPEHGWNRSVPETHLARGVSTYLDQDGKVRGQWIKADVRREAVLEAMRAAAAALAEELPRSEPAPLPTMTRQELATLYTITDAHVGMRAWAEEGGADWNLEIAERTLVGCFEQMVQASPPSELGIVNQLGDYLHFDGLEAVTPTNHHLLNADGQFEQIARVAVRIIRKVVDLSLRKHGRVVLITAEGNHDIASSAWMRVLFAALYEREPRVTVISSPLPYYAIQHGQTMLAFHHGHLKKSDHLPLLFAAQFPKVWGETTKRFAHVGHRHHVEIKEHAGMTVEQHPTLAARDAYAARGGWIAERQVSCITYHKAFGQVSKVTIVPEMLEA